MLLKNCPQLFECVIDVKKDGKTISVTAPETILGSFFKEDLRSKFGNTPQALEDKILLLEKIDFKINSKNAVISMEEHK